MIDTGTLAILCAFIGTPLITLPFIYAMVRKQKAVELLKLRKELLALELEKENVHLKVMEAENKRLDRLIDDKPGK